MSVVSSSMSAGPLGTNGSLSSSMSGSLHMVSVLEPMEPPPRMLTQVRPSDKWP